jgi:hypothetical protein
MSARPPDLKIHTHPLSLVQDPDRVRAVQRGELIHLSLLMLDHYSARADIEQAVLQAFALRGVDHERWDIGRDYLNPLEAALSLPQVRPWFAQGAMNLREVEVMDIQGAVHRIDRLIIGDDNMLEVIDFKVGNREEEHWTQVSLYLKLVTAVFGRPLHGYLLYIDEPAVVQVS